MLGLLKALKRGEDDWLFTMNGEKPVGQDYFVRALHRALEKIGVDWRGRNLIFHSWRHFLNSILINNNVSAEIARHMTGHLTEAMTENYLHFDATQFAGVLEVVSGITGDAKGVAQNPRKG